jgi:hypothetical protein
MLYILSPEQNFIKHMESTYYNTSMLCPIPLGLLGVKGAICVFLYYVEVTWNVSLMARFKNPSTRKGATKLFSCFYTYSVEVLDLFSIFSF